MFLCYLCEESIARSPGSVLDGEVVVPGVIRHVELANGAGDSPLLSNSQYEGLIVCRFLAAHPVIEMGDMQGGSRSFATKTAQRMEESKRVGAARNAHDQRFLPEEICRDGVGEYAL